MVKIKEVASSKDSLAIRWAVGKNLRKASLTSRKDQTDESNIVVWVDINKLVSVSNPDMRADSSDKIDRAIEHWQNDGWMDPPYIDIYKGMVEFVDGRHRILAAKKQGSLFAPVIMDKEEVGNLKELLGGGSVIRKQPLTEHP